MMEMDDHLMPFGKYKGTPMGEVPASYLLWLWEEAQFWQKSDKQSDVAYYIRQNFHALETECPDRIISHRP